MNSTLAPLQNHVFNHATLVSFLGDYARPNDKISDLIAKAELLPLKKGMYALGDKGSWQLSRGLVANHLFGPSYVSSHWMLAYDGLLTERVEDVTSMCMGRARQFSTPLGRFSYIALPAQYYSVSLTFVQEGDVAFMAATPEKALCDLLVSTRNLRLQSARAMQRYLLDDLRLEATDLQQLDLPRLQACANSGYKPTLLAILTTAIAGLHHD